VVDTDSLAVVDRWAGSHAFQSIARSPTGTMLYGLDGLLLVPLDLRSGVMSRALDTALRPVTILGVRAV